MEPLDEQLVERIDRYIEHLFTPADPSLTQNLKDADAAGLPAIQVSPNQGKLLYLLVKIAGAKRTLEIGTLGGYSTTWLARALAPGGVLITLEKYFESPWAGLRAKAPATRSPALRRGAGQSL